MSTSNEPEPQELPEPPRVIAASNNVASLTLGIIATVVGVLSLLVGWIPYLGLFAVPVAVIGLLLAGSGAVMALLKRGRGIGMPLVGGAICAVAFIVPFASTIGMSVAMNQMTSPTRAAVADGLKEREDYMAANLSVYDVEARYRESAGAGKVPGVVFKLLNKGQRDLSVVKVKVLFKDADAGVIHEEEVTPVFGTAADDRLKAGHVWELEGGKFFSAKSVPGNWKEGEVEAKVSSILFSKL